MIFQKSKWNIYILSYNLFRHGRNNSGIEKILQHIHKIKQSNFDQNGPPYMSIRKLHFILHEASQPGKAG